MRVAGGRLDERPAVVGVAEGEAVGVVVVGGIGGPGGRVGRQGGRRQDGRGHGRDAAVDRQMQFGQRLGRREEAQPGQQAAAGVVERAVGIEQQEEPPVHRQIDGRMRHHTGHGREHDPLHPGHDQRRARRRQVGQLGQLLGHYRLQFLRLSLVEPAHLERRRLARPGQRHAVVIEQVLRLDDTVAGGDGQFDAHDLVAVGLGRGGAAAGGEDDRRGGWRGAGGGYGGVRRGRCGGG